MPLRSRDATSWLRATQSWAMSVELLHGDLTHEILTAFYEALGTAGPVRITRLTHDLSAGFEAFALRLRPSPVDTHGRRGDWRLVMATREA